MVQIINDTEELYQTYDRLSKNEYSFLLCRIKNFHMMQYLYGKESSDILYKGLSDAAAQVLQEQDYIYRLYSDHFILFLKTQDPYRIIQYIYQIDHAVETADFKHIRHAIALSYGIFFMRHDTDFYQAYDHARFALTSSKDLLKYNTSFEFYDAREIEQAKKRFALMGELEEALTQHEFEIYIQPKVDAVKHQVRGGEALVRWVRHGSEIPLQDFMPMIDKNAFIRRIDLFVFEEVLKLLSRWKKHKIPLLCISVNISRASFEDGFYYLKEIEQIFTRYDIDKKYIEFELSEGICFEDNRRLHRFLKLLDDNGFRCSLDDFGSGYSSFYSLTYLPVHTIKLDASFCLGTWNQKKEIILHRLLQMLDELQFAIVAEGVESDEAVNFFRNRPHDLLQGFYFSKPLPVGRFEQYYHKMRTNHP